jgi:uncharacterized protein (DUF488 family)
MDIFTIGYEGETIEQWIERLSNADITVLIDIREKAISRKKGFSKTALKEHLEKNNIKYIHYRNLGSPSEIRKQLMEDNDYITFFDEYDKYLLEQEDSLKEIVDIFKDGRPCLMCFEKNHRQCHRNSVAKRLEEIYPKKVRVMHL